MANAKNSVKTNTILSLGIGIITGILTVLVSLIIGTIFINNEYIKLNNAAIIVAVIQFISVFCASFAAGKSAADQKIICSIASGCTAWFILIAIAIMFFDGVGNDMIPGLIVVAAGNIIGILASKQKKNHSVRKRKRKLSC